MKVLLNYKTLTDRELVTLTLEEGDVEAVRFLIYVRYEKLLNALIYRYCGTSIYNEDLLVELIALLLGKDGDWAPLRSFQWRSSFKTWLTRVASHLFNKMRDRLIGEEVLESSMPTDANGKLASINREVEQPEQQNEQMVILLEAINRMKNDEYRLILVKILEGYSPKEIAAMLNHKREREGLQRKYKEKVVALNVEYVHMTKPRAIAAVKPIVKQVQEEWYGNK